MIIFIKSIIAYGFLILFWSIFIFLILSVFGIIEKDGGAIGLMLLGTLFYFFYEKFRPMPFVEIVEKYLNIKLPSFLYWKYIKYKFMILIGTDKEYLDKDEEFSKYNKSK